MLERAGVLRGGDAAGGKDGERASAHAADGDPASGAPTTGVTSGCADAAVTVSAPGGATVGIPTCADSGESDQLTVESGIGDPGAARTLATHETGYKQERGFTPTGVGLDSSRPLDSRMPGYGYGSGVRVGSREQVKGWEQVGQATALPDAGSKKRKRRRRSRR